MGVTATTRMTRTGTHSERPDRGPLGMEFIETDTGLVYDGTGDDWRKRRYMRSDLLENRPAPLPENEDSLFFAKDDAGGTLYKSTGDDWDRLAKPVGDEEVDVRYFGYKTGQDGGFADAFNGACLQAQGGVGLAKIPAGEHYVDAPMFHQTEHGVKGDGMVGGTKLIITDAVESLGIFTPPGVTPKDLWFEDFEIHGNKDARGLLDNNPSNIVVAARGGGVCERVYMRRVWTHDSLGLGGAFQDVQGYGFIDCRATNNHRDGLTSYGNCQDGIYGHVTMFGNGDDNIGLNAEIGDSNGHVLARILITGCILGDIVQFAGAGVAFRGVADAEAIGNLIYGAFTAGALISNANNTPSVDILYAYNRVRDTGKYNAGGSGSGIEIDVASPLWTGGKAGCARISLLVNDITGSRAHAYALTNGDPAYSLDDLTIALGRTDCSDQYSGGRGLYSAGWVNRLKMRGPGAIRNAQSIGVDLNSVGPHNGVDLAGFGVDDSGEGGLGVPVNISIGNASDLRLHDVRGAGAKYGLKLDSATHGPIVGPVSLWGHDFSGNDLGDVLILGTPPTFTPFPSPGGIELGFLGAPRVIGGIGDPEGHVFAPAGSIYLRADGDLAHLVYKKQSAASSAASWSPLPGRTHIEVAGAAILQNLLQASDANASFILFGNGKLQWGAGGATALDALATLFRPSQGGGLQTAGALAVRAVATGSRPAANSLALWSQIFDSTLQKPIWTDGTNWRDALGNVV